MDLKGQYFAVDSEIQYCPERVSLFQMFTDNITDAFSTKESLKIDLDLPLRMKAHCFGLFYDYFISCIFHKCLQHGTVMLVFQRM